MMELRGHFGAVTVNPLGQFHQAWQEFVVRNRRLPPKPRAYRPCDSRNADDDKPGATLRLLLMIGDQSLPDMAILFRQAHAHRRDGDPVLQLHGADSPRREQVRITVRGHFATAFLAILA